MQSLADLRADALLAGNARNDAVALAASMRETLGQDVLFPEGRKPPSRGTRPPPKPRNDAAAAPGAAAAGTPAASGTRSWYARSRHAFRQRRRHCGAGGRPAQSSGATAPAQPAQSTPSTRPPGARAGSVRQSDQQTLIGPPDPAGRVHAPSSLRIRWEPQWPRKKAFRKDCRKCARRAFN
ncbi:hypothetical protein WJ972_08805 [Achromobacter insuavis]